MFPWSNLRWTRLLLGVVFLAGLLTTSAAVAGTTHDEGGAVVEAPGVPETDGTATVQIYWTGDSAARTSVAVGATLAGYWLHDAGFALARQWQVGDEHVAFVEMQTGAGTAAHAGYYGVSTKILTSLDPDEFPALVVAPIPAPVADAGGGYIDLIWDRALGTGPNPIAGYDIYRSTDGMAFAKINAATLADTTYRDTTVTFGTTYYYALGLVYRGTPAIAGNMLSANSAPVTPLDATAPDVPAIAAEPAFTPGTANTLAWSSEAASGATAYWAEYAQDAAFTTLLGNSGWIADTTCTFSGLADGRSYWFRVRSRDAAENASGFSSPASSRQDASAPSSHVLALADYKASSTVSLEWAAADSLSGVAAVQLHYSEDGGPWTLYPGGPWTASPIAFDAATTGGDGQYGFYTLASDAVANAETAPETPDATTTVDTQPPQAPAVASLPDFTPGDARSLSWASAESSGATAYRAQASASETFDTIAQQSDWLADSTHVFTGLADGTRYHYRVRARDAAGNESSFGATAASTQDASAPATAVAALPALTNAAALSLEWSGSDAASGLAGVEIWWSRDGAPSEQLPGGPYTTSPIAFDAASHGGDGLYAFSTRGTDAVGNVEATSATPDAEIRVDTTAPAAPAIASLPAFTAGDARTIEWTPAEPGTFRAEASVSTDFTTILAASDWIAEDTYTFTGLADGQAHFFRVRARDAAGNESDFSAAQSSTQDASAPASSAAALPAISSAQTIDIAWSGSDETSGLAGVELWYAKDGGAWVEYPGGPFASSPIAFDAATTGGDGAYRFYTRASDAAGNLEDAPAEPDAGTTIDTAAPGAPSIAGLQTFSAGSAITLTWSDESASGAAMYLAEMASEPTFAVIAATSDWTASLAFEFTGLADGESYWFRVKARDAAANETGWSGTQNTTMDASAPSAALEPLAASLTGDPHLSLAWTGADATSGIQNVDLWVSKDGADFALAASSPFAATPIAFDASALGDGSFRFYVRARDRVGNLEDAPASADAEIAIDTTAPAAPVLAALPAFTPGAQRNLTWSDLAPQGATAYQAQAATDTAFTTIAAEIDWTATLEHTFTDLADGQTYHYRARARDAAGNAGAWAAAEHSTQDATAPATQVAALPPTSASTLLAIAWTGSDAASGIAGVDLYVAKDGGSSTPLPGGPFTSSPIAFDAATMGGDGTYTFYTIGRDAVGNLETAPPSPDAATTIDTAAPDVPAIAALPSFTAGASLELHWSTLAGAAAYRAQAAASSSFATLVQDTAWMAGTQHTFTGLADGTTYWFRVQARDAAQNASAFSAPGSTTMDATPPSAQLAALPALTNDQPLMLEWNGFDLTSGLAGIDLYFSRNGAPFALCPGSPFAESPIAFPSASLGGDGNYAFYVRARDAAGNIEPPPSAPDAQTRIDTTPPNAPAITALPQFSPGSSLVLAWSNQSASGAIEYLAEMSASADFATIATQSGWIATTSYGFNSLDDGTTYWFRVKSRDAALNESALAAVQSTTFDDTAPASNVSALPAVETTLSFPIAWSGTDATSDVASADLYYARDGGAYTLFPGGPWTGSPIPFDAALTGGQGTYAFYTRARDRVGNREPAPAGPDAQTVVNTAAVGAPTLAALPSFTAGASRAIGWTPGANNASYLVQAASDAAFGSIHAQSGWITATSYGFDGLANGGTYWYRVKARSSLGVEGSWSAALTSTQDATAPQSQAAALPALVATQQLDIAWAASDATSGIAGVRLHVSRNGEPFREFAGGPFTSTPIAFDAAPLGGDGSWAFYTRAADLAGNVEAAPASPDAETTIDTAAPLAPAMVDEPESTQGTVNTVAWNAAAGAAAYMAQCASDADFASLVAASDWIAATSWTFGDLEPGTTYWYRARARDAAGNAGAWSASVSSTQSPGYVLASGWNLVSFNVTPRDARIDRCLQSIAGSYNIVRAYERGAFLTYLPSLPVEMNDLQSMNALRGYWIYMTRPDTLAVAGEPIDPSTAIDLGTGWNLAGYLPPASSAPSWALASISGSYALVRGYEPGAGYRTHYPSLPGLSDLAEMRSGYGYWFYMTAADRLVYGGLPKAREASHPQLPEATTSDAASVPTVMDLWSTDVTLDGRPAPAGTVVEAYDAQGRLCGTARVKQDGALPILHLLGDVSITRADEGATPGETITLRVRDRDMTLVSDAIVWEANAAQAAKLEFVATESLLPRAYALAQNVPNPFNPTTTISYAIPGSVDGRSIAATHVDLRIYDVRGRTVRALVSARQAPGRYNVIWNGRDDRGQTVGAGVYFYRLHTDDFDKTRKMMVLK